MNTTQSTRTVTTPFGSRYNATETPLYEVRAGVAITIALNHAVNLLDAAYELAYGIGTDITRSVPCSGWAVTYLTEAAKATVESVYDSLERVAYNVDALQTARTQAEAITRNRYPLTKDNDTVVSMPLHILIDLIQEGICSALSDNASRKEEK